MVSVSPEEQILNITKDGIPYAIICKKPKAEGIRFFCADEEELQIGLMERPIGYQVPAHAHQRSSRTINGTCEFLYVEFGKIKADVFDEEWACLASEVLDAGDFLVFFRGGHAIEILATARVIEVKQGPYTGTMVAKQFRDPL